MKSIEEVKEHFKNAKICSFKEYGYNQIEIDIQIINIDGYGLEEGDEDIYCLSMNGEDHCLLWDAELEEFATIDVEFKNK